MMVRLYASKELLVLNSDNSKVCVNKGVYIVLPLSSSRYIVSNKNPKKIIRKTKVWKKLDCEFL